jgi:hypothetical protein
MKTAFVTCLYLFVSVASAPAIGAKGLVSRGKNQLRPCAGIPAGDEKKKCREEHRKSKTDEPSPEANTPPEATTPPEDDQPEPEAASPPEDDQSAPADPPAPSGDDAGLNDFDLIAKKFRSTGDGNPDDPVLKAALEKFGAKIDEQSKVVAVNGDPILIHNLRIVVLQNCQDLVETENYVDEARSHLEEFLALAKKNNEAAIAADDEGRAKTDVEVLEGCLADLNG